MHLSKFGKILLLIVTLLPLLYMIVFVLTIITSMFQMSSHKGPSWIFDNFAVLFVGHAAMMLLMLGTIAFYVIYIFKSNLDQQTKILWFIVIFVGGPIGLLIFWFMNIWREKEPTEKITASQL